jgi:hypothetical protein
MPAGAIVGIRILDDTFARELSKRTGAAIGFYANGARISSGAPEGFDTAQLDTITTDLKGLENDPTYKDKGFSDVRTLHDDLGVVYARLVGEAWDVGAGYAVARTAHLIGSPFGFLRTADDKDKHSVPLTMIILVSVLVAGLGLGFTFFEHTRLLHVFRVEAERLAKGQTDQLTPSKFRGVYRQIASNLNEGMEKVLAKGGAPRRAADLDAVLGPMPAQPAMSAFSIPGQDGPASDRTAAPASGPISPPARPPSFPQVGPSAPRPPSPTPNPVAAAPGVQALSPGPAVAAPAPKPIRPPVAKPPSPTLVGVAPAAPAPSPLAAAAATPAANPPKPIPAAGRPATTPGPIPFGGGGVGSPPPRANFSGDEDDEETVVSQVPSEILGQLSADRDTGRPPAIEDEAAEWKRVYEEFVRLKKECGEPTDGISFEKFKNTLRKNRDQLLQRHSCKSVRFSVYVKEGKAALKASPVRE